MPHTPTTKTTCTGSQSLSHIQLVNKHLLVLNKLQFRSQKQTFQSRLPSLDIHRRDRIVTRGAACHRQGSRLSSTRRQRPSHHKRKVFLPGAQLNIKEQLVIKGAARHQDSSLSTRDTADNKHTCSRTSNSTSQNLKCPITETSSQGHNHCLLWLSHLLQCHTS